ncbi:hypothetical protein L1987_75457 [Smallanthus sonchifolius]|uniref:Uncharacterized protein n=1 Tax=Smallanthus sonchifolius TaxID=185202 RepID=A0ACB9A5T0_9ASTR|nr:hypothetical protein L1987_75457 [Smallanthus sonchifolius]
MFYCITRMCTNKSVPSLSVSRFPCQASIHSSIINGGFLTHVPHLFSLSSCLSFLYLTCFTYNPNSIDHSTS